MDSRLRIWVAQQGVYNCIITVDHQHYRINTTVGLSPATAEEVAAFPHYEAPEWLTFLD